MPVNAYVSNDRGNDSTGAGTAASPYKTIGKAAGPGSPVTPSGLTSIYVEPGVYDEGFTLGLTPSSTNPLQILGDCDGSAFAAGGYATPKTGVVEWCGYSDDATPGTGNCLYSSGKSYVTIRRFKFYGGDVASGHAITADSATNWTITDCIAVGPKQYGTAAIRLSGPNADGAVNFLVERCDLYGGPIFGSSALEYRIYERAAEYAANAVVRNCRLFAGSFSNGYGFTLSVVGGSGGKLATGVTLEFCTLLGQLGARFYDGVTTKPLATPNVMRACSVVGGNRGVTAGDTTHVSEDWNLFQATTPRTNVSTGANTKINYRPAYDFDDARTFGLATTRPTLAPDDLAYMKIPSGTFAFPAADRFGRTRNADTAIGAVEIGYDAATSVAASLVNGGLVR